MNISGQEKLTLAKVRTELALRDFKHFLPLVTTIDETTYRKMKWPKFPYLDVLADELASGERILWIPKSRRAMATWLVTAYVLWNLIKYDNYLVLVQSQTEPHSKDWMHDRLRLMWQELPRWFKFLAVPQEPEFTALDCRFKDRDTRCKAFPAGPHQYRQYTPSLIVLDEAAHHDEFEETMTAITPFLEKNTRIILLSSVVPGFFADVAFGKKREDPVTLFPGNPDIPLEYQKGIQKWRLVHGGTVILLHFSADYNKGQKWLDMMEEEMPGGLKGPQFRQEYNCEADAFMGARVYPHFEQKRHVKRVKVPEAAKRYLGCDYGVENPTACISMAKVGMGPKGPIYHIDKEFYETGLSIEKLKLGMMLTFGPPEKYEFEWIDPSTDSVREVDTSTQYWLFNNGTHARNFFKADRSSAGIVLISEWLHQDRLTIDPSCRHTIYEMEHYRRQQWASGKQDRNAKEQVLKKDDHCPDAIKYIANGVSIEEFQEEEVSPLLFTIEDIISDLDNPNQYETDSGW